MKISKKTIDTIFSSVIIEDVISDFVRLKKTGANYKGLSPFNDEKTPSFVVSPSKEIWKDFSSGKGGNVISFLMEHEQYTYPEALLYLAKKYNITIEYDQLDEESQKQETEREASLLVLNFVKNVFCKNLVGDDKTALNYLESRKFKNSVVEDFEIGFCPNNDNTVITQTKKAGYNIDYLIKTKILTEKLQNRFSGRLIFPIHSITGQVLGFGGRILSTQSKRVKYLNSDSSELYQKSKVLYGLHLAKKHIKTLDSCYLVEGYTDVLSLYQMGIKNVVANCGTALTDSQIRLIKRFSLNITVLFDSDPAGTAATLKAIDMILQQGMTPNILTLPANEDPASFIEKISLEEFKKYIEMNTLDFINFKYNLSSSTDTVSLIEKTKSIIFSISLIEDKISRTLYLRRLSKKSNIDEKDLLFELEKLFSNKVKEKSFFKQKENSTLGSDFLKLKTDFLEEFQLIRLLINYGHVSQKQFNIIEFIVFELEKDNISFTVPLFNMILKDLQKQMKENTILSKDYFLTHLDLDIRSFSTYVFGQEYLLGSWEDKDIIVLEEKDRLVAIATEALLRFKLKRVQAMVEESLSRLKTEEDSRGMLLENFTRLSNLEKKIQKELGRLF